MSIEHILQSIRDIKQKISLYDKSSSKESLSLEIIELEDLIDDPKDDAQKKEIVPDIE